MAQYRSSILRQHDEFGEIAVGTRQSDPTSIPYVMPANDNVPPRITLSARCRALLHRLVAKDRDASWRIAVAEASGGSRE